MPLYAMRTLACAETDHRREVPRGLWISRSGGSA